MHQPKPCPFCGSMPDLRISDETLKGQRERIYAFACSNKSCAVFKSRMHRDLEVAMRDWNHRVSSIVP